MNDFLVYVTLVIFASGCIGFILGLLSTQSKSKRQIEEAYLQGREEAESYRVRIKDELRSELEVVRTSIVETLDTYERALERVEKRLAEPVNNVLDASVLGITGDPSRNVAGRIEALDPATRAKISWEAPPSETGASTTEAKDSEPKIAPSDCLFGVDDTEAGQRVDGGALPREAAAPSGEAEQPVPLRSEIQSGPVSAGSEDDEPTIEQEAVEEQPSLVNGNAYHDPRTGAIVLK